LFSFPVGRFTQTFGGYQLTKVKHRGVQTVDLATGDQKPKDSVECKCAAKPIETTKTIPAIRPEIVAEIVERKPKRRVKPTKKTPAKRPEMEGEFVECKPTLAEKPNKKTIIPEKRPEVEAEFVESRPTLAEKLPKKPIIPVNKPEIEAEIVECKPKRAHKRIEVKEAIPNKETEIKAEIQIPVSVPLPDPVPAPVLSTIKEPQNAPEIQKTLSVKVPVPVPVLAPVLSIASTQTMMPIMTPKPIATQTPMFAAKPIATQTQEEERKVPETTCMGTQTEEDLPMDSLVDSLLDSASCPPGARPKEPLRRVSRGPANPSPMVPSDDTFLTPPPDEFAGKKEPKPPSSKESKLCPNCHYCLPATFSPPADGLGLHQLGTWAPPPQSHDVFYTTDPPTLAIKELKAVEIKPTEKKSRRRSRKRTDEEQKDKNHPAEHPVQKSENLAEHPVEHSVVEPPQQSTTTRPKRDRSSRRGKPDATRTDTSSKASKSPRLKLLSKEPMEARSAPTLDTEASGGKAKPQTQPDEEKMREVVKLAEQSAINAAAKLIADEIMQKSTPTPEAYQSEPVVVNVVKTHDEANQSDPIVIETHDKATQAPKENTAIVQIIPKPSPDTKLAKSMAKCIMRNLAFTVFEAGFQTLCSFSDILIFDKFADPTHDNRFA
jgi:hypothetical protein